MLAVRAAFLFSTLVIVTLGAVIQSFPSNNHYNGEFARLSNKNVRSLKKHNQPPRPPSKKKPNLSPVRDDRADAGELPYTAEIIREGNEEYAGSLCDDDDEPEPEPSTAIKRGRYRLSKRINGQNRDLLNSAQSIVDTDESDGFFFDWDEDIETQTIATDDLSGCTVVVIASPFAVLMVHILERRASDGIAWLLEPDGPAQQEKDKEFLEMGKQLINDLVKPIGGSLENGFNGWFPIGSTAVHVVAPAANPDYDDNNPWSSSNFNPWYTTNNEDNPMGLIYPYAAQALLQQTADMLVPGRFLAQAKTHTYRRRYSDDQNHETDDRDIIVLKPKIMENREVWLEMLYDDDKMVRVAKLA